MLITFICCHNYGSVNGCHLDLDQTNNMEFPDNSFAKVQNMS